MLKPVFKIRVRLLAPALFKYEISAVTCQKQESLINTMKLFEKHVETILTIVSPSENIWLKAEEITKEGHDNNGYPSLYDSIYHALAIESKSTFLTADKKHYAKTQHLGNIQLLENRENIFNDKH